MGFKARHTARRVLRAQGFAEEYPIDIFDICKNLGIETEKANIRALHGLSINCLGIRKIYYSRNLPVNRQRFTVAHELGHLLLGHAGIHFDQHQASTPRLERQANQFAAELLVPKIALSRIWHQHSVIRLAKMFQVSYDCMVLRLNELGCLHQVKM